MSESRTLLIHTQLVPEGIQSTEATPARRAKKGLFTETCGIVTPSVSPAGCHLPRGGRQSTVSLPKGSLPEGAGAQRLREFLRNPTRKREEPIYGGLEGRRYTTVSYSYSLFPNPYSLIPIP